jgi:preprotein translocase subunit SecG
MFGFLIALEVVVAIVLIVAILMQASKGGGLAGTFGGGSMGMVFGVRRTADFLIKTTQVLATVFILLSLVINLFFLPRTGAEQIESILQRSSTQEVPAVPQLPPTEQPLESPSPAENQ